MVEEGNEVYGEVTAEGAGVEEGIMDETCTTEELEDQ